MLTGLAPTTPNYLALWEGLAKLGFAEGRNLEVDRHGYSLKPDELAAHAAALAAAGVDLIQCSGASAFRAAQHATGTIPIIGGTDDIVGEGIVPSLSHPGGNTTGVTILAAELDGKRLQIPLELLPDARRIGILAGGDSMTPARLDALTRQARPKGVELVARTAQRAEDIGPALDAIKAEGAAGLNVLASALLFFSYPAIIERTAGCACRRCTRGPTPVGAAA
ncbi:MAG TPA: ABC transporter substrate binding protein [Stellaceae bacterium]|nr:ABC transporter substrate binding protein [Stellaceae bacterium]